MINTLDFFMFKPLMAALKKETKQTELAKIIGVSTQKVNQIFNLKLHLVYPQIGKWRGALKFPRVEGDYFELLMLIHSYPFGSEAEKPNILRRAFHLVGRIEEQIKPKGRVADNLIYQFDPLFPVLLALIDMDDFPKSDAAVPKWVTARLSHMEILGRLQKNIPPRIKNAWSWLRKLEAVTYDKTRKRWVKSEPKIQADGQLGPDVADMHKDLLRLCAVNAYEDFAFCADGPDIIGDQVESFTLPKEAMPLFEQVISDHVFCDLLPKLKTLSNPAEMKRLAKADPKQYKELIAFSKDLERKGYDLGALKGGQTDGAMQLLLGARKLA